MVDYISFSLPNHSKALLSNPLISSSFKQESFHETGELTGVIKGNYKGLEIIIDKNKNAHIKGSIHKVFSNGKNHTDFFHEDLIYTLNLLSKELHFELQEAVIHSIEFGLNFRVNPSPSEILSSLCIHKPKGGALLPFERRNTFSKGDYYTVARDRYTIKLYDKGKQNRLKHKTLRYEIKVTRMAHLENIGVCTLNDLVNKNVLESFAELLDEVWRQIYLKATPGIAPKTPASIIKKGSVEYWNSKKLELSPTKFNQDIQCYRSQVERHSKFLHENLHSAILSKIQYLLKSHSSRINSHRSSQYESHTNSLGPSR